MQFGRAVHKRGSGAEAWLCNRLKAGSVHISGAVHKRGSGAGSGLCSRIQDGSVQVSGAGREGGGGAEIRLTAGRMPFSGGIGCSKIPGALGWGWSGAEIGCRRLETGYDSRLPRRPPGKPACSWWG